MSKRRIERTVDELNEEILGDLTPDERLKLVIEAMAHEKDEWVEQLRKTIPKQDYHGKDPAILNRNRLAFILAQQACYALYTSWLSYQWLLTQHTQETLAELFDLPSVSDHAPDGWQTDFEGRSTKKLIELYIDYHTYDRFASELFDVPLETWLTATHPDAETIVPAVEETMDMEQATIDAIDADLSGTNTEDSEEPPGEGTHHAESLGEIVSNETEHLHDLWDEMLGPNPNSSAGPGLGEL